MSRETRKKKAKRKENWGTKTVVAAAAAAAAAVVVVAVVIKIISSILTEGENKAEINIKQLFSVICDMICKSSVERKVRARK